MPASKLLFLFNTIHDVLRAEKLLKKNSIVHELIPVPRNLSSDCGMSILLDGDPQSITILLAGIQTTGIYTFDGKNYTPASFGNPDQSQN